MNSRFGCRLHFGLISMSQDLPRRYGGIGLSIPSIGGCCTISKSHSLLRVNGTVDNTLSSFLIDLLQQLHIESVGIDVHLNLPRHSGFGTGTQIRLAIISLLTTEYNLRIPATSIVSLTHRGGASGIGLRSGNEFGLVFDLGRPYKNVGVSFIPSANQTPSDDHQYLPTVKLSWNILLAIPKLGMGLFGPAEQKAFNEICPIPPIYSFESAYEAVFGVYASALEADYTQFCSSLARFQELPWKKAVLQRAEPWLIEEKTNLESLFQVPFFVSSWGPGMCAFITDSQMNSIAYLVESFNSASAKFTLTFFSPNNS